MSGLLYKTSPDALALQSLCNLLGLQCYSDGPSASHSLYPTAKGPERELMHMAWLACPGLVPREGCWRCGAPQAQGRRQGDRQTGLWERRLP